MLDGKSGMGWETAANSLAQDLHEKYNKWGKDGY